MSPVDRRRFLRQASAGALAVAGAPRLLAQTQFLTSVSLGDFELYYEVHGEGPPVVLAHGAGGTHFSWWRQIPAMSEHFQCVTFDHRGFDYSRDIGDRPGRAAFVDDLHGLLDHLKIEQVSLVGQSMGGWTTLGFASAYPERVTALVLCDTPGGYTDPDVERLMADRPAQRGAFAPTFGEREPELVFCIARSSGRRSTGRRVEVRPPVLGCCRSRPTLVRSSTTKSRRSSSSVRKTRSFRRPRLKRCTRRCQAPSSRSCPGRAIPSTTRSPSCSIASWWSS